MNIVHWELITLQTPRKQTSSAGRTILSFHYVDLLPLCGVITEYVTIPMGILPTGTV